MASAIGTQSTLPFESDDRSNQRGASEYGKGAVLLCTTTQLILNAQAQVRDCMLHMEDIFKEHSRNLEPFLVNIDPKEMSTLYYKRRFQIHQSQHLSQISIRPLPLPKAPAECVEQHQQQHNFGSAAPHRTHTCKMQAQAQAQNEIQDVTF